MGLFFLRKTPPPKNNLITLDTLINYLLTHAEQNLTNPLFKEEVHISINHAKRLYKNRGIYDPEIDRRIDTVIALYVGTYGDGTDKPSYA